MPYYRYEIYCNDFRRDLDVPVKHTKNANIRKLFQTNLTTHLCGKKHKNKLWYFVRSGNFDVITEFRCGQKGDWNESYFFNQLSGQQGWTGLFATLCASFDI